MREAKDKAKDEANGIIANASREIESQKQAALREIKSSVGTMAVTIAENILKKELSSENSNADYVNRMVDGMNLN